MLTVSIFLVLGALVTAIMSAVGKCPLWVPVILIGIFAALQVLPK